MDKDSYKHPGKKKNKKISTHITDQKGENHAASLSPLPRDCQQTVQESP